MHQDVSPERRRIMQGNRSKDTQPELAVRRLLHAQGLRYRVNARPEPTIRRTADIVFTKARVAVFIDGCFWHACPTHSTVPRTNTSYWTPKLERNQERDRDTNSRLTEAGWLVLRFWEHEEPVDIAEAVKASVLKYRPADETPGE